MNFCVENIGTTISSSQVESDGHEAKNLLAKDPTVSKVAFQSTSKKGFLADSFVRPPVTLSIKFPLCIEISHIVINPKLGAQASSGFTIETLTSYNVWKVGQERTISKNFVAREFLDNPTIPSRVVFRNPRYVPRSPFALLSKSTGDPSGEVVFNLKHPSVNACERVIGVDVTILRAAGSSVPGLGNLEIWGQPCIRCPKEAVQKMLVTWLKRSRKNIDSSIIPPTVLDLSANDDHVDDSPTQVKRRKLNKKEEIPVPEEFLDSLTFEIMCQPIRLPCGIAVDATTLQRFYTEEACFGRPPSDPFRNPYTETVRPIADTALKIRIDQFITKNSSSSTFKTTSLQNCPRTVGTGAQGFSKKLFNDLNLTPMTNNNRMLVKSSSSSQANASCTVSSISKTDFKKGDSDDKEKSSSSSSSSPSLMDNRLQEEVVKLLGVETYLMKSTTTMMSTKDQEIAKNCIQCQNDLENDFSIIVYSSTSCPHIFICRTCVLKLTKDVHQKCPTCSCDWNVQDLQRMYHRS